MSLLHLRLSMSLDGFVAGPAQSVEHPLGMGGTRLHEWVFPLASWRAMHGQTGGEVNDSSVLIDETNARMGATIMGRNMFGGHPGPWDERAPWRGWWGEEPPFHHDVFVLTHHARASLSMAGGTTFHFVTEGIHAALARARQAAGPRDIMLGGGAHAARQYLAAGLVDEMTLSVAPTLLGDGERPFEGVGDLHGLVLRRTVSSPGIAHLLFARG